MAGVGASARPEPHSRQKRRPRWLGAPQRVQRTASASPPWLESAALTFTTLATWPEGGVTTALAAGCARSDMRLPQFVQKMIPAGLSHPQLPQRI